MGLQHGGYGGRVEERVVLGKTGLVAGFHFTGSFSKGSGYLGVDFRVRRSRSGLPYSQSSSSSFPLRSSFIISSLFIICVIFPREGPKATIMKMITTPTAVTVDPVEASMSQKALTVIRSTTPTPIPETVHAWLKLARIQLVVNPSF